MTHTPEKLIAVGVHISVLEDGGSGEPVAVCFKSRQGEPFSFTDAYDNAARLVHCWNCHDDLLAALERTVDLTDEIAIAAIAKAKGDGT